MKLCNDCDLNYRLSKNKRLLVELTLIQVAQLTAEAEEPGQGRSLSRLYLPFSIRLLPKRLNPLHRNRSLLPGTTRHSQPATMLLPYSNRTPHTVRQNRFSRNIRSVSAGFSPRSRPDACQSAAENIGGKEDSGHESRKHGYFHPAVAGTTNRKSRSCCTGYGCHPQADANWEDYIFNEKDLNYYWREFAARLPKEEAANAGRMMNMQPQLLKDGVTFEVAVDNDIVQKYMQQLAPHIETHLRTQLHNRKIRMTVRVSAPNENIRAYSHVERFQMMSQKNPKLLKLKEALGLELS